MPNIGTTELIFVGVVLLVLFGAKRLPELGAGLGKGIREFKKSVNEIKHEVSTEEPAPQIRNPARAQVTPGQAIPTQSPEEVSRKDV
jgi:sec-independent protein translocase protein TatA